METHVEALSKALAKTVDLEVVVANDGPTPDRRIIDGVLVNRLATAFQFEGAPVCPSLAPLLRSAGNAIVHVHLPNPLAVLLYLVSGHRGPLVVTWHSDIVRQRLFGALLEPFVNRFLRRCSAIIATSPNYLDSSRVLSRFRDKCRVIPLGIDPEDFERVDQASVDGLHRRYGPRLILAVGRLVYYKGFEYLVRAMGEIDGRLLIVGEGPLADVLRRQISAWGFENKVVMLGRVENLRPYYHAAKVLALPSIERSEAFGLVQLEAMACGKPIVNTRLKSGVPYVSLDGVTGLTVPPRDWRALADAISRLLNDPELGVAYGEAARRRVLENFTLDGMVAKTLGLYDEVANPPAHPIGALGDVLWSEAGR